MAVASPNSSFSGITFSPPTNESVNFGAVFEEPLISRVIYCVIFSLTALASLIGNAVVYKATSEFPAHKPLSYYLVSNLAVAEIIGTLCLPFMFLYQYLGYWPFGNLACKLIIPLQMVSLLVVTGTLATIAVYRFAFIAVQASMRGISHRSKILLLATLWFSALAVALPAVIFHKEELAPNRRDLVYCNSEHVVAYEIARFVLNFGVPYLVMVVSYGGVALALRRHIRNQKRAADAEMFECAPRTEQTQVEDAIPQQGTTTPFVRDSTRRLNSTSRVTDLESDLLTMIYALIVIFVVCYLPYQIHFIFHFLKGYDKYPEAEKYAEIIARYFFLLTTFPSAVHPLCYGTMSKFYARFFARFVLCKRGLEMR